MSRPKIRVLAKAPGAAELASWPLERVQEEYQKHLDQWMERSSAGQQNTWRKFEEMDGFYIEIQRRKYGPGAVAEARAEASNMRRMSLSKEN